MVLPKICAWVLLVEPRLSQNHLISADRCDHSGDIITEPCEAKSIVACYRESILFLPSAKFMHRLSDRHEVVQPTLAIRSFEKKLWEAPESIKQATGTPFTVPFNTSSSCSMFKLGSMSTPSSPVTSSRSRGLSRLLRVTPLRDSFPQQNRAMWPKRPQLKHRIVFWRRPRSGAIDVGLRENSFLPTSLSEAYNDDVGNSSCLINSGSHSAAARAALTAVWSVSAWACFTARRNSTLKGNLTQKWNFHSL